MNRTNAAAILIELEYTTSLASNMEWWQLFLAIIFVMLMLRRWRDRQDSATGGRDASSKRLSKTASYNIRIPEAKMRVKNKKDTWKWSRSEQRKKGKR